VQDCPYKYRDDLVKGRGGGRALLGIVSRATGAVYSWLLRDILKLRATEFPNWASGTVG
jgi:hypothetical protein